MDFKINAELLAALQAVAATEMFLADHPQRIAAYKTVRDAIAKAEDAQSHPNSTPQPVAYMQGTALYWPEDAEVGAPDCIPLYDK